jgi:pimeloyl-ACP methyl ester carboxylesterase
MPTQTIDGATTLYFSDQGRGPSTALGTGLPLVLTHGFPLDSRMWNVQATELSDRYRVICPDMRGFGQSQSQSPFTIEQLADDLHELLTAIKAVPAVLAGLSMGGYVALAYARKYPGHLRGLILLDTRPDADTAEGKANRDKMVALARASGSKAVADAMLPRLLAPDAPRTRPQVARELRSLTESCPPETIEHALLAMRDRPDQTDVLASISVPTLIIVGDADAITPPAVAQAMHDKINRSQLAIIRGAGHMTPMEQPAQVNQAIRQFMETVEGMQGMNQQAISTVT